MLLSSLLQPVTKCHFEKRVLGSVHPLHLFRIIQDVDRYKEFLPLCKESKVFNVSPDGRSFQGSLTVGMPPLWTETYTSLVRISPETMTVTSESIQSTRFDSLKSRWTLAKTREEENSIGCHVDFEVEITVSDPIIVNVLDQFLEQVAGKQVEAFEKRCHEVPIPEAILDTIIMEDYKQ
jgi:coenzyme Q-binding protein COQ10